MLILENEEKEFGIPRVVSEEEVKTIYNYIEERVERRINEGATSITIKTLFKEASIDWATKTFPVQILYIAWNNIYQESDKCYKLTLSSLGLILKRVCDESKKYKFEAKTKHGVKKYYLAN